MIPRDITRYAHTSEQSPNLIHCSHISDHIRPYQAISGHIRPYQTISDHITTSHHGRIACTGHGFPSLVGGPHYSKHLSITFQHHGAAFPASWGSRTTPNIWLSHISTSCTVSHRIKPYHTISHCIKAYQRGRITLCITT